MIQYKISISLKKKRREGKGTTAQQVIGRSNGRRESTKKESIQTEYTYNRRKRRETPFVLAKLTNKPNLNPRIKKSWMMIRQIEDEDDDEDPSK